MKKSVIEMLPHLKKREASLMQLIQGKTGGENSLEWVLLTHKNPQTSKFRLGIWLYRQIKVPNNVINNISLRIIYFAFKLNLFSRI